MPVISGSGVLAGSEQSDFGDVDAIFTAKTHHGLIHVRLETADGFPENDDFRQSSSNKFLYANYIESRRSA